jgi:hypothetical protein
VRGEIEPVEYVGEQRVAHVDTARVSAERRHHRARDIGSETAADHDTAAMSDARHRVQMP